MSDDIDNFMPILEEHAAKSRFVLEIGVGKGTGSTLALFNGVYRSPQAEKLMVSVDIQDYMEWKPPVPWWHLVIGSSTEVSTAERVAELAQGKYFEYADIIFIDTVHTPEQIDLELWLWDFFGGPKTIWLFHDTYMMGQYNPMTDTIKKFAASHSWKYSDVSTEPHGLGMMTR